MPDLILLDGGKGHVSTIVPLLASMGVSAPSSVWSRTTGTAPARSPSRAARSRSIPTAALSPSCRRSRTRCTVFPSPFPVRATRSRRLNPPLPSARDRRKTRGGDLPALQDDQGHPRRDPGPACGGQGGLQTRRAGSSTISCTPKIDKPRKTPYHDQRELSRKFPLETLKAFGSGFTPCAGMIRRPCLKRGPRGGGRPLWKPSKRLVQGRCPAWG